MYTNFSVHNALNFQTR